MGGGLLSLPANPPHPNFFYKRIPPLSSQSFKGEISLAGRGSNDSLSTGGVKDIRAMLNQTKGPSNPAFRWLIQIIPIPLFLIVQGGLQ